MKRRNFLKYFTGGLIGAGLVPLVGKQDEFDCLDCVPGLTDQSGKICLYCYKMRDHINYRQKLETESAYGVCDPQVRRDNLRKMIVDDICKKTGDKLEYDLIMHPEKFNIA